MKITFKAVSTEDCILIREWIKNNEFTRHWYFFDKIPRLQTLKNKINQKLNEAKIKMRIVLANNVPIGYIQSYPVDGNGNWTKQVKIAKNMVSIDYFIGDINFVHKGLGKIIILKYLETIIKKDDFEMALISPDPNNIASRRCAEKCGFEYIKTVGIPYSSSKNKEAVYVKKLK